MSVSKDHSIILQVAGKIAADLTPSSDDIMVNVANWNLAYDAISDALLSSMGMSGEQVMETEQRIVEAFNGTTVQTTHAPTTSGFQVRIKGKQHGPIPEWLHGECAKKGVTEVWDNRDGLAANPKRPWFKAVNGDAAFWEPRRK
jgi:hypothetical protein